MTRREVLALALASPALSAANLDRSRLAVLADETGHTPKEWIAFAHQHQLKFIELRNIQRDGNSILLDSLPVPEVKAISQQLKSEGLKVSFLNTALLKYALPGTTPVLTEDWYDKMYARLGLTADGMYKDRNSYLQRAIAAAHAVDCTRIRTFSFWRVADPRALYPRLVDLFGEMGNVAGSEGCQLLIETEYATNVATSEEMRDILLKLPSKNIAVNWDPQNSFELEPDVFPTGYNKLPKSRIQNVQIKAEGLFGKKRLDWGAIMRQMNADGYSGLFGLETHHGHGEENFKMSHRCMDELVRLATAASTTIPKGSSAAQ